MLIENQSRLPDDQVAYLIKWVANRFSKKISKNLAIGLQQRRAFSSNAKTDMGMVAVAHDWIPKNIYVPKDVIKCIIVDIKKSLIYPFVFQYTKRSPVITYYNWEEELIVTIAHEMTHLEMYYSGVFRNDEASCEKRASQILEQWRKRSPKVYKWPNRVICR